MTLLLALSMCACSTSCLPGYESATEEVEVPVAVEIPAPEVSPITWQDCSGNLNDHPCDFTFKDQSDNDWNLYDHYGSILVLDFSVMWCGPCKTAAAQVSEHMDQYGDEDVIWVTILLQNETGEDVDLIDVQSWADDFGVPSSSPVLQGDYSIVDVTSADGYPVTSYPTLVVVDRGMVIYRGIHGWSRQQVEGWIEELLLLDSEEEDSE